MSTTITKSDFAEFVAGYIECALWSSSDESDESGGEPLDSNYTWEDIHPDTLDKMKRECAKFLKANRHLISDDVCKYKGCPVMEFAGHDFWLTRNGHGCGFWDGDWDESVESELTRSANKFGTADLYIGDDGKIHQA